MNGRIARNVVSCIGTCIQFIGVYDMCCEFLIVDRWSFILVMPIYTKIGFYSNSCSKAPMAVRLFSCHRIYFW